MASEVTTETSAEKSGPHPNPYLIAGIVAVALASAATGAYIVWRKSYPDQGSAESVQELLDKAHRTLHLLEDRLGELQGGNLPLSPGNGDTAAV